MAAPSDRYRGRTTRRHTEHHLRYLGIVHFCSGPAADAATLPDRYFRQRANHRSAVRRPPIWNRIAHLRAGPGDHGIAIYHLRFRGTYSRQFRRCSRRRPTALAAPPGRYFAMSLCRIRGSASSAALCSHWAVRLARPWRSRSSSATRIAFQLPFWRPGRPSRPTIANEFTEAVGDLYTSSLIELGLILFVITFIVLAIARYMLMRIERRIG